MDVFPVILPSHLQIGDQNGQKKSTFFGCTQSNGFTMSRILNLVKKLEKSQPISVKLVTKIVKKIDLFWVYPIEWVCDESNFKPGQKIGKIATNFGQNG